MEAYVRSASIGGITTIEFYHPNSNSLPAKVLEELALSIKKAGDDHETTVIILRSSSERRTPGKSAPFCAGASFEELSAIKSEAEGLKFFSGFAHVINAMRNCPKYIIGRIHGKCVGGGVGLAAAVDYAIAAEGADVKLSELALGIGPFVVGPAVERKIGNSAFMQLAIDATMWRNADWARRKGLYSELHPDIEGMDESITRLANTLVKSSPQAMAELKKVSWSGTDHWDTLLVERAAISGRLVFSEFAKKAIEALKKG